MRFESDLVIESDGDRVVLSSDDGVLVVTSDRLIEIVLSLRGSAGVPSIGLRQISAGLAALGATVKFQTQSTEVLVLGAGAKPQRLTRLLGAPHVEIESARVLFGTLARATWSTIMEAFGTASKKLFRSGRPKSD